GRTPKERLVVPVAARVKTDVPADRAHVPKLRRAYDLRGFGQRRRSLSNPGVLGDRGERRPGADVEMTVALDARGVTNPRERDEQLGRELPPFHVGEEVGAARDEHHPERRGPAAPIERTGAVLGEQLRRLSVRARLEQTESGQ